MMGEDARTDQYQALMRILEEGGVVAFPDSGTLLFLHRDGAIPSRDKDIDLAVLPDAIPQLLSLGPEFRRAGYRVKINRYRGLVYTVALKPLRRSSNVLPAAIHVYFPEGSWLVSPQARQRRPLLGRARSSLSVEQRDRPRHTLHGLRRALRIMLRRLMDRIDRSVLVEAWPLNRFFEGLVWRIPSELILPLRTKELGGLKVHVPNDVEGYLAARYGDWRSPRTDWAFWIHDGLITQQHPRDLVERLTRSTGVE